MNFAENKATQQKYTMENVIKSGRILVVEDDNCNIQVVKFALEDDYEVIAASNGLDAINMIPEVKPDFILLDWCMPVMDGLETLQHLKRDEVMKTIPVAMLTGSKIETEDLLLAYRYGVIDFIRKPFNMLELKARAKSILEVSRFYKAEIKKREMSLASYAIQLSEANEFLLEITEKIQVSNKQVSNCSIINDIKQSSNAKVVSSAMQQFGEYFLNIHEDFDKNLLKAHPNISPAEMKLATFLRLNLNTKEISAILHQAPDSIRVSRTRLRRKFNLDSDTNLTTYLMGF